MKLRLLHFIAVFASATVLSLVLTPIVREINRRLGMVDKPDPRRINKIPIPRGGGMAVFISVCLAFIGFILLAPTIPIPRGGNMVYWKLIALSAGIAILGLLDDRYSLQPKVKLLGQVVIAALSWAWIGIGFRHVWPNIPAALDCAATIFWIIGAVNAFNLIDGLDGLASGLAFIATAGTAGSLIITGHADQTLLHFAFAGALIGFLRYNYNPASVFLGDSGSMYIGYMLSTLPLVCEAQDSMLVSVGVPLLAMGVPIFDTSLAILRRSIRHVLSRDGGGKAGDEVMTADCDHLHHRVLRSVGLSQRKAAWILYTTAMFLVAVGLVSIAFKSQRLGLWLAAVTVISIVIFRDMARIELFDAGRLIASVAHNPLFAVRRRLSQLAVTFYLSFDLFVLTATSLFIYWILLIDITDRVLLLAVPIRVFSTFFCMVLFRVYRTIWARAMLSNYLRLLIACVLGSVIGTVGIYYAPGLHHVRLKVSLVLFAALPFLGCLGVRLFRDMVRDIFYAIDCSRLKGRKDISRVLVYGSGLRYRAFRRELVRTAASNDRIIVGLIDDDILLRNHYIGGIRVMGPLEDAPEIINRTNADSVVIACQITEEWKRIVCDILEPTGVKITFFTFEEKEVT